MLTEICAELRNYFLRSRKEIRRGTFVISSGSIEALPFLKNGQYFRVVGSVFNDGVHQYPNDTLTDEEFEGEIWPMAVPPQVLALDTEITSWVSNNSDTLSSPYTSESFGGYSYSKASGSSGGSGGGGAYSWKDQFAAKLSPYRRISVL